MAVIQKVFIIVPLLITKYWKISLLKYLSFVELTECYRAINTVCFWFQLFCCSIFPMNDAVNDFTCAIPVILPRNTLLQLMQLLLQWLNSPSFSCKTSSLIK